MATAKTQQQTQQQQPKAANLKSADDITGYLVKAHTNFEKVVQRDVSGLIWDREMKFALARIMQDNSGTLRKCLPDTISAAMESIGHLGLTLNPTKQHCTLIARWNKIAGIFECHLLPMYRGLVYLATQAGVTDIVTDVVYRADAFAISRTSDGDYFEHKINTTIPRTDSEEAERETENWFLGVYVAARMPGSKLRKVEWIPREDIFKMRDASESNRDDKGNLYPSAPWVLWFDENAKKSGLKRASKRWEEEQLDATKWTRFQTAVDMDHRAQGFRLIEGQAEEVAVEKLTMDELAEIDKRTADIGLQDPKKFIDRICGTFGVRLLADVPRKKYAEILERITESKKAAEAKRGKANATAK